MDSEHNSLFRLLQNADSRAISKMYITASGGPFYRLTKEEIRNVKKEEVLKHPNWDMGAKITVDSAGMINKALEIIEAYHLFQLKPEELGAVIHPQSYIHAFLKYKDGSFFFHGSEPDMLYPLSHSFFYPQEPPEWIPDPEEIFPELSFAEVDHEKYPGFSLGVQSAEKGGAYPAIFNAANEEAVAAFLNDQIKFHEIPNFIENTLSLNGSAEKVTGLDDLLEADVWARRTTQDTIKKTIRETIQNHH